MIMNRMITSTIIGTAMMKNAMITNAMKIKGVITNAMMVNAMTMNAMMMMKGMQPELNTHATTPRAKADFADTWCCGSF